MKLTIDTENKKVAKIMNENGIGEMKIVIEKERVIVMGDYGSVIFKFPVEITMDKFFKVATDEFYLMRKIEAASFNVYEVDRNAIDNVLCGFGIFPYVDDVIEIALSSKSYETFEERMKLLNVKTEMEYDFQIDVIITNLRMKSVKMRAILKTLSLMTKLTEVKESEMMVV